MAGIVKADLGHGLPGTERAILMPRACPCMTQANRPKCVEVSFRSGWVNLCPFIYGVRVLHGGMIADVRGTSGMLTWMGYEAPAERDWQVLCLRKESADTAAGAHLRD